MRKERFGVVTSYCPGFDLTNSFCDRTSVRERFVSRKDAEARAQEWAEMGVGSDFRVTFCVVKFHPGKGWKIMSQHDPWIWPDHSEEDED